MDWRGNWGKIKMEEIKKRGEGNNKFSTESIIWGVSKTWNRLSRPFQIAGHVPGWQGQDPPRKIPDSLENNKNWDGDSHGRDELLP